VPDDELATGGGPHTETEDIGPLDSQPLEERGGIVGELLVAQQAVDIGRAPADRRR
jgi:hypothetical protein